MICFKKEEQFEISGKGTVITVKNPLPPTEQSWTTNYEFLMNTVVEIDGEQYHVIGIEGFANTGFCRGEERIGLLVKLWPKNK